MSKTSGRTVFTSTKGVDYLLDKYLSPNDRETLVRLNDGFHEEEFSDELERRLVVNSGGKNFIPPSYEAELVMNAKALIGSRISSERLKTRDRRVTVITTAEDKRVYQDESGRFREFGTGRFTKP